jgi:hypothetical protein
VALDSDHPGISTRSGFRILVLLMPRRSISNATKNNLVFFRSGVDLWVQDQELTSGYQVWIWVSYLNLGIGTDLGIRSGVDLWASDLDLGIGSESGYWIWIWVSDQELTSGYRIRTTFKVKQSHKSSL